MNRYTNNLHNNLKYKFNDSEKITNNYSQACQDIFTLSMLDGKKDGVYVEIGADHPGYINNTYLLENNFNWSGVSFEIIPEKVYYYNSVRKNKCLCADAITFDYKKYFEDNNFPTRIDYVQLDIEPVQNTYAALKQLLSSGYKFSVITFETDLYNYGSEYADKAKELLESNGYTLLIKNVANDGFPFEDWYIDTTVINPEIYNIFMDTTDDIKEAYKCILNL